VYCEILYRYNNIKTYDTEPGPREPPPTLDEVEKAAGPNALPIELLKLGGDSVVIITCAWNRGKWPEDWTLDWTFVPIYKKGNPTVCANNRTISLILHASKVLLQVILGKIQPKTELKVAEEQAGFRPPSSCIADSCYQRQCVN